MADQLFCYVTCKDQAEAREIGNLIVGKRLAACANILPDMQSIYWWDGKLTNDEETVLIFKTTQEHFEALKDEACNAHSYDCPCVVALPIVDGNEDYLNWIKSETT